MTDPAGLADAARALAEHLRFHQALGIRDLPLQGEPLGGPAAALRRVEAASAGCTRCKLSQGRSTIVFGSGSPEARLVFIGEGPGEEEDRQGKPFVGRAGQLLTKMLESVGLTREEVYICNIVKCRPPGNRNPEPEEIAACAPFLAGQLAAIQPGVICTLGTFAAQQHPADARADQPPARAAPSPGRGRRDPDLPPGVPPAESRADLPAAGLRRPEAHASRV